MRKLPFVFAVGLLATGLCLGGCDMDHHADHHASMWASVTRAVAVLQPTKAGGSAATGVIWFETMGDHVHVHGTITGLAPNSVHAFHIHEFGDVSSDNGSAAGGHYNPEGHPHGDPADGPHHAGDMGNITADASGTATIDLMIHGISVAGKTDPIIGRSLVLHANRDDFSQSPPSPTPGNAGGRIAVGVIGIAK